jgi:membrane protease subunit HflK
MAWNEPGGGKRDPWKSNNKSPDLDALLKRLQAAIGQIFGGMGSGGSGSRLGIISLAVGVLVAWCIFDSWTVVDARQIGVVLRFGQFERVMHEGFNLKLPRPIEQVTKVEVTNVRSVEDQVRMLTQDENIIQIDFNVQYQIADAKHFLYSIRDPDDTLKQAAESAVRQVIGSSEMDTALSGQGSELVSETKKVLQQTLDGYDSGIQVTDVNFKMVSPPSEVQKSFDDVNSAREDKQRIENQAQAYSNKVVPEARGEATRIKTEAEGYKAERIARAEGDAQRFGLLYGQYKAAPEVTRKRLYLETLQQVLSNSVKVLDMTNGKNLIYLPLDKLKGGADSAPVDAALAPVLGTVSATPHGGQQ